MCGYLGIDTSNYTTSVCVYDCKSNTIISKRQLLPVKDGEVGIRQSNAVFHHVQQLPVLIKEIFDSTNVKIKAVGASSVPRKVKGSYMPCFTVGSGAAASLSSALNVPLYNFSHQQGHIAAALYSADKLDLINKRFLAFHISGGTTEALLVNSSDNYDDLLDVTIVGNTLDLNAGQLVDRVGVMLGLSFPCGKELEKLALKCSDTISLRPTLKECSCCLSGVENICRKLYDSGKSAEYIALYCLKHIQETIAAMTKRILNKYGDMPVLFAGGVMSNSIIRSGINSKLNSAVFAKPEFSTDNAAGIAVLTYLKESYL